MSTRWNKPLTPLRHTGRHRADPQDVRCDFCDELIMGTPVRDAEAVSWIGAGASTYCSRTCLQAHSEQRINAAGNEPS